MFLPRQRWTLSGTDEGKARTQRMETFDSLLQDVPIHTEKRAGKGAHHDPGDILDTFRSRSYQSFPGSLLRGDLRFIIVGDRWAALCQFANTGKKDVEIAGGSFGCKSRRQGRAPLRSQKDSGIRAQ